MANVFPGGWEKVGVFWCLIMTTLDQLKSVILEEGEISPDNTVFGLCWDLHTIDFQEGQELDDSEIIKILQEMRAVLKTIFTPRLHGQRTGELVANAGDADVVGEERVKNVMTQIARRLEVALAE